jgi:hypothetical protein
VAVGGHGGLVGRGQVGQALLGQALLEAEDALELGQVRVDAQLALAAVEDDLAAVGQRQRPRLNAGHGRDVERTGDDGVLELDQALGVGGVGALPGEDRALALGDGALGDGDQVRVFGLSGS